MGVDTRISLPPNVRVQDVASVVGALAGLTGSLGSGAGVRGIETVPQMCRIGLWRADRCFATFNFHFEGYGGRRAVVGRSTAFNIAMGRALVDFFGGWVDYSDSDDEDEDYVVQDKPDPENCPEDGAEWDDLQRRIASVKPLTSAEIKVWAPCAAYGDPDERGEEPR